MRPLRLWPAAVMSVLAVLIMIGSGVVAAGINPFPSVSASVATAPTPAVNPSAAVMPAAITPSAINPSGAFCNWVLGAQPLVIYQLLGPSCAYSALEAEVVQVDAANANISANNIITALGNYENMSAAATANVNATFQELLSYYEGRAEAIAAEYVGQNWSNLTYTTILDESGLTSSIEGMEFALADQQYQIWNATAASWNTAFGFGGQFASAVYAAFQLPIGSGAHGPGYSITSSDFIAGNGYSFNASYPYERWGLYGFPHDSNLYGISNGSYFNLMPGGTIIEPAICGTTGMYAYLCTETQNATFTIQDLTTGFNYTVPKVSWATYISTLGHELQGAAYRRGASAATPIASRHHWRRFNARPRSGHQRGAERRLPLRAFLRNAARPARPAADDVRLQTAARHRHDQQRFEAAGNRGPSGRVTGTGRGRSPSPVVSSTVTAQIPPQIVQRPSSSTRTYGERSWIIFLPSTSISTLTGTLSECFGVLTVRGLADFNDTKELGFMSLEELLELFRGHPAEEKASFLVVSGN